MVSPVWDSQVCTLSLDGTISCVAAYAFIMGGVLVSWGRQI